jgi:hypothetical protein
MQARGAQHRQQQSEGVHDDVPLAAVDLLPAVEVPAHGRHRCRRLHRLGVDDTRGRLPVAARRLADPIPQPVVELGDHALVGQRRKNA